jgi:hypothetical protein
MPRKRRKGRPTAARGLAALLLPALLVAAALAPAAAQEGDATVATPALGVALPPVTPLERNSSQLEELSGQAGSAGSNGTRPGDATGAASTQGAAAAAAAPEPAPAPAPAPAPYVPGAAAAAPVAPTAAPAAAAAADARAAASAWAVARAAALAVAPRGANARRALDLDLMDQLSARTPAARAWLDALDAGGDAAAAARAAAAAAAVAAAAAAAAASPAGEPALAAAQKSAAAAQREPSEQSELQEKRGRGRGRLHVDALWVEGPPTPLCPPHPALPRPAPPTAPPRRRPPHPAHPPPTQCDRAPHRPSPPPPPAAVASCAALFEAVNRIRAAATARGAARRRYRVTLDCGGPGGFNGACVDASGGGNLGMAFSGRGELVVASAKGCRAALGGVGRLGDADASDFFMLEGQSASLTLRGLDIDCGGNRTGVFASKGGHLTLDDVGVRNCSSEYGAGLMSISTSSTVTGGAFEGNVVRPPAGGAFASGGGAFFYAGRRGLLPPYK